MSKAKVTYRNYVYYDFLDDEIFVSILPPDFFATEGENYWLVHLGEL